MKQAARIESVQAPVIPVVGALIRDHPGTISLGQGVVHYPPPTNALKRMMSALDEDHLHTYKAVGGIDPLLTLIEKKLADENALLMGSHSRAIVTAGGNMAFMNAILAITNPGDEIIIQSPYYFNHEMAIRIIGCEPIEVPTDSQYQLQTDAIEQAITPRTRAVVTVSPNNPTGAVYSQEDLRRVNAICRKAKIFHINDEAYEYFTYNTARHFSPGSIDDVAEYTISLYSLSKAYGFASWRIGYMVVPNHLVTAVRKIQDTIIICPPVINQYAAAGALEVGAAYCREYLPAFAQVRQMALEQLAQLGDRITVPVTDGAFYLLIRVNTKRDPMELVEQLVRDHGVALIPGTAFGVHSDCSLRLSYGSLEKDTVAQGLGRFAKGIKQIIGD